MADPTVNEYAPAEVDHLAEVITRARLAGVSAGSMTLARLILDAGYRFVDFAEGHVIDLRDSGWTISHPLACRPRLFECEVNRIAEVQLNEPPDLDLGRYPLTLQHGVLVFGERKGGTDD